MLASFFFKLYNNKIVSAYTNDASLFFRIWKSEEKWKKWNIDGLERFDDIIMKNEKKNP